MIELQAKLSRKLNLTNRYFLNKKKMKLFSRTYGNPGMRKQP